MREILGQITFSVSVLIIAIGQILIADTANVLSVHSLVLTFYLLIALIAPSVRLAIITFAHSLIAGLANMLVNAIVSAIYDFIAPITIVVLVTVKVTANELSVTFVTVAVIVIIVAIYRHPDVAMIADVITVIISVIGIVGIRSARCLLSAKITASIFVLVNVIVAGHIVGANIAYPISILIHANVRQPFAALVTVVVAVLVGMSHIALHTVCRAVTFVASSVAVSGTAII